MHSRFDYNQMAGFLYDPFFTEYDALLIRNTIYPQRRINMFDSPLIVLQPNQLMFLICPAKQSNEIKDYFVEIQSSSVVYKIVLQVHSKLILYSILIIIDYYVLDILSSCSKSFSEDCAHNRLPEILDLSSVSLPHSQGVFNVLCPPLC